MIMEHIPGNNNVADYLSRIPPFTPSVPPTTCSRALSLIADSESCNIVVQHCTACGIDADLAV